MVPKPKFKWANAMNKRTNIPKVPRHLQIPKDKWTIFPGDQVQILRGPQAGETGEVLNIVQRENRILVRGINIHVKHIKPNPEQLKGNIVSRESLIPVNDVVLIDPVTGTPTSVQLVKVFDEVKGYEVYQRLLDSQTVIAIPPKKDPFEDKKAGALDTKLEDVQEVTWTPNIKEAPFPVPLLNQLEKWRRVGKEGQAF
ncbi:60S ribosomal protein L24 [Rhizophlyctis rosea]|uniref:60S ribosomal protein L24 n=1 Tax=Rhizophlyctis rosea TaxID=64517 RepID=A0AAD5SLZ5_9FUNG|nr:60S ribosomal protein L24 [Rhizophlyctis rosea]